MSVDIHILTDEFVNIVYSSKCMLKHSSKCMLKEKSMIQNDFVSDSFVYIAKV